ncbi:reverse transcriptase domain-containing protein [Tanacetum coccineum]
MRSISRSSWLFLVSSNPTPFTKPIVSTSSPTLTPFGDSDFLLEETDAFLAIEDEPISPEINDSYLIGGRNFILEKVGSDKLPHNCYILGKMRRKALLIQGFEVKQASSSPWQLSDIEGYFQIPIDPQDQEKTTFTCPYGMFAYRRMPFGLCNAPGTFQRCMMAIFHDMIEKTMEVFMDDFSVFRNSFRTCLSHLDKMLKRCEDTNLCLNWEKSHFMVRKGYCPWP